MSHFHDRFKEHAVHGTLSDLIGAIESANLELEDSQQVVGYDRFRRIVDFAKRFLAAIDPDFATKSMLDQIQGFLANMKDHHDSFIDNKDWNLLNQPADGLLDYLRMSPHYKLGEGERAFADELEKFRQGATSCLNKVKSNADSVIDKYDKLTQQIESFEKQLTQFNSNFEQQKGRIDTLIDNQQAQFLKQQAEFSETFKQSVGQLDEQRSQNKQDFDALLTKLNKSGEKAIKLSEDKLNTAHSELETKAGELCDSLQKQLDEAEKIVGLIGNTGLTGNYQRIANEQGDIANLFRWVALGCMFVMIVFVVIVIFNIDKDDFSWDVALFRLLGATTLSVPAIYCARESTRHRKIERRNRRVELELVSLKPYLSELTDEERKKIIAELSKQYFGIDTTQSDEEPNPRIGKRLMDVNFLMRIIKFLIKQR